MTTRVSTYLNFMGTTEAAFTFYATVFGTSFGESLPRIGDVPTSPGASPISELERQLVLHVEMPILSGHVLMGTDMLASMGHELRIGNNTTINLEPDSQEETERLYTALSEGAADASGRGGYFGCMRMPASMRIDSAFM